MFVSRIIRIVFRHRKIIVLAESFGRNNIRGLYENHGSTKIEHHLNNMVDQMSDEQVQELETWELCCQ